MSAHTVDVKIQLGDPNRWYAICDVCGSLGWALDLAEAESLAVAHSAENS